jgi:hypothetical protein
MTVQQRRCRRCAIMRTVNMGHVGLSLFQLPGPPGFRTGCGALIAEGPGGAALRGR